MNYHSESSRTLILQVIRWSFEALGTLSCDSVGRFFRLENNQYVERLSVAVYLIQDLAGTQHAILGDANSLVITIPIVFCVVGFGVSPMVFPKQCKLVPGARCQHRFQDRHGSVAQAALRGKSTRPRA